MTLALVTPQPEVFRAYAIAAAALLVAAGLAIAWIGRGGRRDVSGVRRTWIGWLIMAPLALGALYLGRVPTIVGVGLLALGGFREFARATGLYRDWTTTIAVYLGVAGLTAVALVDDPETGAPGWYGLYMAMSVYVVAGLLTVPVWRNRAKGQLQPIALAIVGFVYFGWMFGHLAFLANAAEATGYLLFLIFAVELNDVAAFTCGRLFGRTKLRSEISPNKTVEGSLGALLFSLALPWLLRGSFPHFDAVDLVLTGLIVGVGGQLGDLSISFIKRDLGIKDMGALIPGHGGVLDRLDSLIYVAPIFFHLVRWRHGI